MRQPEDEDEQERRDDRRRDGLRPELQDAVDLPPGEGEEAEELCREIALIRGGRLLARDSAAGLRETYAADSLADVYVKAMAA